MKDIFNLMNSMKKLSSTLRHIYLKEVLDESFR